MYICKYKRKLILFVVEAYELLQQRLPPGPQKYAKE